MRTIFSRAGCCAVRVSTTAALLGLLAFFTAGEAPAGFCSATSCNLTLAYSDLIGTPAFGTVTLSLSSNEVAVDVNLASAYRMVGSADNPGGGLRIDNSKAHDARPASGYSDYNNPSDSCQDKDCRGDGFAYASHAAYKDSPQHLLSFQQLWPAVSSGTSHTDVQQLLRQFSIGPKGPAYFLVEGCAWDPKNRTCGSTGRSTATRSAGATLALLAAGLVVLGLLRWKQVI